MHRAFHIPKSFERRESIVSIESSDGEPQNDIVQVKLDEARAQKGGGHEHHHKKTIEMHSTDMECPKTKNKL